jgi:hypothetical protein
MVTVRAIGVASNRKAADGAPEDADGGLKPALRHGGHRTGVPRTIIRLTE